MPTAVEVVEELLASGLRENWSLETFLGELLEQEMEGRHQRRIEHLKDAAHLPVKKTLATFDQERLPLRLRRLPPQLCSGDFVDRAENLLVFGLPSRAKAHFVAAVGHELVNLGRTVFFTPTYRLVDSLLRAKRDLLLEHELCRLDRFEVLILDDNSIISRSRPSALCFHRSALRSLPLRLTVLVSAASSGQRDSSGGSRLLNKAYFICH